MSSPWNNLGAIGTSTTPTEANIPAMITSQPATEIRPERLLGPPEGASAPSFLPFVPPTPSELRSVATFSEPAVSPAPGFVPPCCSGALPGCPSVVAPAAVPPARVGDSACGSRAPLGVLAPCLPSLSAGSVAGAGASPGSAGCPAGRDPPGVRAAPGDSPSVIERIVNRRAAGRTHRRLQLSSRGRCPGPVITADPMAPAHQWIPEGSANLRQPPTRTTTSKSSYTVRAGPQVLWR